LLVGLSLPIEPLQILWVNMVSSVALATVLAFEATEPDAMRRPPRNPRESLLTGFVVWRVGLVSTLFMAGIFGMFEYVQATGGSVELARTAAVNTLVVMEIFYLFSVRYLRTASFTFAGVRGTPRILAAVALVIALQLVFTYAPFMQAVFRTETVSLELSLLIASVGPALLAFLEIEKWMRRRLAAPR
jgi:magnesium-transporting ATPase (P-type)